MWDLSDFSLKSSTNSLSFMFYFVFLFCLFHDIMSFLMLIYAGFNCVQRKVNSFSPAARKWSSRIRQCCHCHADVNGPLQIQIHVWSGIWEWQGIGCVQLLSHFVMRKKWILKSYLIQETATLRQRYWKKCSSTTNAAIYSSDIAWHFAINPLKDW